MLRKVLKTDLQSTYEEHRLQYRNMLKKSRPELGFGVRDLTGRFRVACCWTERALSLSELVVIKRHGRQCQKRLHWAIQRNWHEANGRFQSRTLYVMTDLPTYWQPWGTWALAGHWVAGELCRIRAVSAVEFYLKKRFLGCNMRLCQNSEPCPPCQG